MSLGVGCDGLLPQDDPGPDRSGENQTLIAVLNNDHARAETQHVVGPDADVAAGDTAAGDGHGFFGRRAFADGDDLIETIGFHVVVAGGADAGDPQREFLCALQGRQDMAGENGADRGNAGLAGKGHGIYSATGGGSLSSTS
jgi:hypothetical protein